MPSVTVEIDAKIERDTLIETGRKVRAFADAYRAEIEAQTAEDD